MLAWVDTSGHADLQKSQTFYAMPRTLEIFIQALIVVCAVAFAIETLPDLSPRFRTLLWAFEIFTVAIFTIEYGYRLWTAENRFRFAFSFFGIVDLLSILPFFLSLSVDLRSFRIVRLLRLVRILKLGRTQKAVERFRIAFSLAKEEFALFFAATVGALYFAAVGIYYCENGSQPMVFSSVPHSLWWAVVTLTTVGYGDNVPVTFGGRVFTGVVLMIGLGIVSLPAGILSSALQRAREIQTEDSY